MKRGANETQASSSTQEGPFANLLPELIGEIASFLPSYHLTGQHAIQTVSSAWHSALDRAQFKKAISNKELIACVENEADCLRILKDEDLFQRFSLDELLQIVCKHPAMVDAIIDKLDAEQLCQLGKRDIEVARRILNTPELAAKLSRGDLPGSPFELIGYHFELAQAYFSDPKFPRYITGTQLQRLAYHLPIALHILNTPKLFACLTDFTLSDLCQRDPILLKQVLARRQDPLCAAALARTIGGIEVKHFVYDYADNIDVATYLIDEHHDFLSGNDLAYLGSKHLSIAQTIFNTKVLLEKLSVENLVTLGQAHKSIAQSILENQALCARLNEFMIQGLRGRKSFIRFLLDDTVQRNRFVLLQPPEERNQLTRIFRLFEIPEFRALLSDDETDEEKLILMIMKSSFENEDFRKTHEEVLGDMIVNRKYKPAQLAYFINILNNENLRDRLAPSVLAMLCKSSSQAAMLILNDDTLRNKLSARSLRDLVLASMDYAKIIFAAPSLYNKLLEGIDPASFLSQVCSRHLAISHEQLQDPDFVPGLQDNQRQELRNMLAIREQIISTKDALLDQEKEMTNPTKRRRRNT